MHLVNNRYESDELSEWDDDFEDSATPDETVDIEKSLSSLDLPPAFAKIPGGPGHLVLNGPGAGTAIVPDGDPQGEHVSIQSRDEALSGASPLFVVHRPHANAGTMPRLMASVVSATRGKVAIAASVDLPKATDKTLKKWFDDCGAASLRIADPSAYLMDPGIVKVRPLSERALRWRPYLSSDSLKSEQILDNQRALGANLLLSPGRALDPHSPQAALDEAFAQADDALAHLNLGEHLAVNLTLPSVWLSSNQLQTKLFGQLLDQEQYKIWHIRVQWPASLRATQQPTSEDLLKGYKRLAQLAADEERVLILPQTGLTGWFQLAFGSTGFGAGLSGAAQAFKEVSPGGNGNIPEVEKYFEPSLLHTVERPVHETMRRQAGFVACDCPYCPELHSRSAWDHTLAKLHALHWSGRLAGAVAAGRTREAVVRRRTRDAIQRAASLPLASISNPRHLAVWDRLL